MNLRSMHRVHILMLLTLVALGLACMIPSRQPADHALYFAPWLQIGAQPASGRLDLYWQATDGDDWAVEFQSTKTSIWKPAMLHPVRKLALAGKEPRYMGQVTFDGLIGGSDFTYRLLHHGQELFRSRAHAPQWSAGHTRFVAMGDIGAGSPDARRMAGLAFQQKPDYLVIPGDIAYDNGQVADYDQRFWPVYNADKLDSNGAPLMRSITFIGAPGNHDTEGKNLGQDRDGLAYFYYWDQPLNGPGHQEGAPAFSDVHIPDSLRSAFLAGTGDRYPVMANFSFDQANVHWLFLDANPYVDWTNSALRAWVREDLRKASSATWKFVLFHHPGFNSSRAHFEQQQMRGLSPIFDSTGVDMVFTGHVHNYQRSYPMRFFPEDEGMVLTDGGGSTRPRGRVINGVWTLDKSFDGVKNTRARGVIYLVTGAGGQDLYDGEQEKAPDTWQKFTKVFHSTTHSLTVVDIDGRSLAVRQVDLKGKTVDAFRLTK